MDAGASEDEEVEAQQRARPRRWGEEASGRRGGEAKPNLRAVAPMEAGAQRKARPAAMAEEPETEEWVMERGFGSRS